MYFTYILRSKSFSKHYIGQTEDIEKRLAEHNSGETGYTSKYFPWELIYSESFETRSEAMKREKYFKSYPGRKWLFENKILVAESNPNSD